MFTRTCTKREVAAEWEEVSRSVVQKDDDQTTNFSPGDPESASAPRAGGVPAPLPRTHLDTDPLLFKPATLPYAGHAGAPGR